MLGTSTGHQARANESLDVSCLWSSFLAGMDGAQRDDESHRVFVALRPCRTRTLGSQAGIVKPQGINVPVTFSYEATGSLYAVLADLVAMLSDRLATRFVELAPDIHVNPNHIAMVRPHTLPGWVAVVFPNGGHELVAGSVDGVLAQLCGETAETT